MWMRATSEQQKNALFTAQTGQLLQHVRRDKSESISCLRVQRKLLVGLPIEFYDGNVKGLKNQSWCEWNENVMESYS